MVDLKQFVVAVPDFPQPGILFRDIMPLLRQQFESTIAALDALVDEQEWSRIDLVAGIESRGFILGAALALRKGKGFLPIRKQGKLPPPVTRLGYQLEYGSSVLEMQAGEGAVLVVDDVVATGGTMLAAAELCVRSGFAVHGLLALVDLKLVPGLHWESHSLRAALTYD